MAGADESGGVRFEHKGARWVFWGDVDADVRERYEDEIETAGLDAPRITLDLSDVRFIDSSGLRLLYLAARRDGPPPRIVGADRTVRDLLELAGVDSLFAWPRD